MTDKEYREHVKSLADVYASHIKQLESDLRWNMWELYIKAAIAIGFTIWITYIFTRGL